jgi:hypothetical protein
MLAKKKERDCIHKVKTFVFHISTMKRFDFGRIQPTIHNAQLKNKIQYKFMARGYYYINVPTQLAFKQVKARLAQSAERKTLNLVVVGSSPTVGEENKNSTHGTHLVQLHHLRVCSPSAVGSAWL